MFSLRQFLAAANTEGRVRRSSFLWPVLRHHDWGGYHAPRHWVLFAPETFRSVAERAGFVVDRLTLT
jgi:hypothetical protein